MKREDAKNYNWFGHNREDIEKHIDKIYDDYERKKEIIANQLLEIEDYLNSEVHSRCEYDIYSNLINMIQKIEN